MDENLHAQMLDEQLKKLRAQLAEKEKRDKEKKAHNNTLLTFVEKHGIKLPLKHLEQFNLPLVAVIHSLLSLKATDKRLKAMREDSAVMRGLFGALSKMENPSANMPLPSFPESVELLGELTEFLGTILAYLARAYPADLTKFLFQHEKFFYLLLRNAKEWTKAMIMLDESDPSTHTISHALHLLVLYDMEKGAFGAKKFLTLLVAFLDAVAPLDDVPSDTILCSMSLALQASRSLLREFQGRSVRPDKEFFISSEDLPASLISKPAMERIMKILSSPSSQTAAGVILPFLLFMVKLDCHCVHSGKPPAVAPAFYALEGEQGLLHKLASDWPSTKPPKDIFYLYGTYGDFPLMYTELWTHVFHSMQAGKLSITNQPKLIPILKAASDAFCSPDTTVVLRNEIGSLIRAFLPLCNPSLLSQLDLVKRIKGVIAGDVRECIPQAKQVFLLLKSQPWLPDSVKEDVVDGLIKLMASEKNKGTPVGGVSKEIERRPAASSRHAEQGELADQMMKDIEAKMAALQEAKKQKMRSIFEQIHFHALTPDMLEGKEGEYVKKNVNFPDEKGRTMLHIACMAGNQTMVDFLVKVPGINKKAFDLSGKSPRQFTQNPTLIDILEKNGFA